MVNKLSRLKSTFNNLKQNDVYIEYKEKVCKFFKNGLSKKQTVIIASIFIISSIILLIPKPNPKSVIGTINRIETSILKADTTEFSKLVDINNITLDISNAIFDQIEELHLTQIILSTFKTNLEDQIHANFYSIIKEKGDYSKNLNKKNAVLSKLINLLLGKSGKIISLDVLKQDNNKAEIQIIVFKPDLNMEIPINFSLSKTQGENWKVTNLLNSKLIFKMLNSIEKQYRDKITKLKYAELNKIAVLRNFKIEKVDPINNSIFVKVSLENISNETLNLIQGTLNIYYNNKSLGFANIKINDIIKPKAFYEKIVAFKITKNNILLNNLATAKPEALKSKLNITKILFSESNIFKTLELN